MNTCRFDYSRIPLQLRILPRWIGFKLELGENGKKKKLPACLSTGKPINAHNQTHHLTFDDAHNLYMSGAPCDGLGFVVCSGDNITFIDFDHIQDSPERRALARRLGISLNTWGETSQSGEGAHFFVGGTLSKSFNKSEVLGVEGYSSGRFVALTGRKIKGTPDDIAENQAALDALFAECCGAMPAASSSAFSMTSQSSAHNKTQEPETPDAVARVRAALSAVPADGHSEWLEMGMALHSTGWHCSRPVWDEWSKTSSKYDPATQDSSWNSLSQSGNAAGKITLGSLFHLAKQHGWVDSAVPEHIKNFNAEYFVSNEGGRTRIFREEYDPILQRHRLVAFQKESFLLQHANQYATINGNSKPAAQAWLGHPQRRTFDRITFAPGQAASASDYNLWRGFSVAARPGNWSLLRQHIFDIVCHGNAGHFDYVVGWMALAVQCPNRAGEVALVIRGGRGTGKGTLARAMLRLFGQHGMQINNGKHITGNFNSHLRDCVMLNVDEGFWAGDKQAEGVLKGLITEPTLTVEGKGRDAITAPNYLHIIITSNEDWVVPAGPDERRFAVFDVSNHQQKNEAYFAALYDQLEHDGYEAMLHDLLNYDLSRFSVRRVPNTTGLQQQKLASLEPVAKWFFEKLAQERLNQVDSGWVPQQSKKNLTLDFAEYARRIGRASFNSNADATCLGAQLTKILGSALLTTRPQIHNRRESCWVFPPLATCRAAFETAFSLDPVSWNNV